MGEHVKSESTGAVPADSGAPPASPSGSPGLSRWIAVIALAVAFVAIALAAWPLLHPMKADTAAPQATDQQVADAKARACTAFNTVRSAVALQTHVVPGAEPAAVQAVAANARLAMAAGGSYLLARLDVATPPPVAAAIRSLADDLQDIAMHTLAGATNEDPAQAARLRDAEAASGEATELCK